MKIQSNYRGYEARKKLANVNEQRKGQFVDEVDASSNSEIEENHVEEETPSIRPISGKSYTNTKVEEEEKTSRPVTVRESPVERNSSGKQSDNNSSSFNDTPRSSPASRSNSRAQSKQSSRSNSKAESRPKSTIESRTATPTVVNQIIESPREPNRNQTDSPSKKSVESINSVSRANSVSRSTAQSRQSGRSSGAGSSTGRISANTVEDSLVDLGNKEISETESKYTVNQPKDVLE